MEYEAGFLNILVAIATTRNTRPTAEADAN